MSEARITWIGGPVLRACATGPFSIFEALAVGGQQHHLRRLAAHRGQRRQCDVGFVEEAENGGGGRASRDIVIQQQDVGAVRHALV